MSSKIKVFVIILLCIFSRVFSVNIGSDTIVNLFTTQQIVNNNDRIASFAFLKGGFKLDDQNVTGDFDSVFPVYGDVGLAGGTLDLSLDLVFSEGSIFSSLGNINGNGQAIRLASSIQALPDLDYGIWDSIANTDFFTNDWSYDDKFIAIGDYTGGLSIYEVVDRTLVFRDSVDLGDWINEVHWHPNAYYVVIGKRDDIGSSLYIYEVDQSGNLIYKSQKSSSYSVKSTQWHPSGNYIAYGLYDFGAPKYVYIYNVSAGILGSEACSLLLDNTISENCMKWYRNGLYLAVSVSNVLYMLKFDYSVPASCTLTIDDSLIASGFDAISWNDVENYILAAGSSSSLTFYKFDQVAHSLTLEDQHSMNVDYLEWKPGENIFVMTTVGPDDTKLYQFDPSDYSITLMQDCIIDVYGPTWAHSVSLFSGYYYGPDLLVMYGISIGEFNNLNMFLNGNITLNSEITFVGDSLIDGQGNTIDLATDSGIIIVDSNSELTLKNMTISGISGNNIRCTDSTSICAIENCTWILDNNYSLTQGHLEIYGDFEIMGEGYNFNYETNQQSIVNTKSKMILNNVTFVYDPVNSSKDLISLTDNSSILQLNNAIFDTGSVGINLTKGKLQLIQDSDFSTSDEITFGDGSLSSNDLVCEIPNGVKLQILDGTLNYKNVSSISWPTTNLAASLYMYQDSVLNLYQNLNVGAGSVIVGDNVTIGRASGKSIVGSLIPLGSVVYTNI